MRFLSLLLLPIFLHAQEPSWTVLKRYDSAHLLNIALPLGGIGTGTVSLGGRGELRDWEIMNKPGKKFSTITDGNQAPFFAIRYATAGKAPVTKALLGPLDASEYQHYEGRPVNHHGLPRFQHAGFETCYPFGRVKLSDDRVPVKVEIVGFNPLVPGDADASSIPIAVLRYKVTNTGRTSAHITVCGTLRNFIGVDGSKQSKNWKGDMVYAGANHNQNRFRTAHGVSGIYMYSDSVDHNDPAWGTFAIATPEKGSISWRRSSIPNDWENALLDLWDDLSDDGKLTDKDKIVDNDPMASLAVDRELAPGTSTTFTFYLAWHFPNRTDWNDAWRFGYKGRIVGNHYTTRYKDAWDVLEKEVSSIPVLEKRTADFVNALAQSDLPAVVKESALFNLSTLRSQTVFRLPSGHFMGWEGSMNEAGSCYGNCTHVWNYETASAFLFGDLARTMREVEFVYGTKDNGKMMNRVNLPLESNASLDHTAAADGQMGAIMRFYREWQLSGDNPWLEKHWPKVKAAMQFAWIKGGWDEDRDGVEEGEQDNTMDVAYYGPNPQMQFWYFGALRASAEMAKAMGDTSFANECTAIFRKGSAWVEKNLFNGEYYEQKITDPVTRQYINMDDPNAKIPPFQLGRGCLVDQLAGQYLAHVCGLGYLGDPKHLRTTLTTIGKYNRIERFDGLFNNMRSFAMGNESGLVMASWPKGRLKVPFPYFAESMTGFEYTAAIGMLYEGQTAEGLRIIKDIRDRFNGEKRNPFDEPECGHHYARAMASWSAIPALTGFHYSGVSMTMDFHAKPGTWFWSNGHAWGTMKIVKTSTGVNATLKVIYGKLDLVSLRLEGMKKSKDEESVVLKDGGERTYRFARSN